MRCVQELQAGSQAAAPSLQAAAAAGVHLEGHGWDQRPGWEACLRTAAPQAARSEPGGWANGWQRDAALALHSSFRERVLLPAIRPSDRALLRSQAGPHAGAWLAAIPADPATTFAPDIMHLALRRRLRLPVPLTRARCGGEGAPGCRTLVDNLGYHALACPRTGLLARRGFVLERAWIQVVRETIGPESRSCATAVAGQHHGTRGRSRRSTTPRFRHIWCCRTRRGPVLRCNTCVTCPPRWQPPSGSA